MTSEIIEAAKLIGAGGTVNNRLYRRLQRHARQRTHNWVRTTSKAWKAFGRDEQHKWRRWHGNRYFRSVGGWEYGGDRDVAHHSIAALNPDLSQAQDRAHG